MSLLGSKLTTCLRQKIVRAPVGLTSLQQDFFFPLQQGVGSQKRSNRCYRRQGRVDDKRPINQSDIPTTALFTFHFLCSIRLNGYSDESNTRSAQVSAAIVSFAASNENSNLGHTRAITSRIITSFDRTFISFQFLH